MKKKTFLQKIVAYVLIFSMIMPLLPSASVKGAEADKDTQKRVDHDVLFYNDFESTAYNGLEGDALASAIFGAGNYRFGESTAAKATMKIENGKLRLIGDKGNGISQKSNRTQLLLASNQQITQRGVIIECDYTLNQGAKNFFDFLSKPINMTVNVENSAWTSGVWAANSNTFRTCLRTDKGSWEACGKLAAAGNYGFNTVGTDCNLKLEISPETGMKLSIKKASIGEYTVVQTLTVEEMTGKGFSFADYLDNNVRMIYALDMDVTIDNLKVSLIPEKEELTDGVLFDNNFDKYNTAATTEELAEQIFKGKFTGFNAGDTKLSITPDTDSAGDKALRIQAGKDGKEPTRTQMLLAQDERVKTQGITITGDFTFEGGSVPGSQLYFYGGAFKENPAKNNDIENGRYWVAGFNNTSSSIRIGGRDYNTDTKLNWLQKDTGFKDLKVKEKYTLAITVSPEIGIVLSVAQKSSGKILKTCSITAEEMNAKISAKTDKFTFADMIDSNVRLVTSYNQDVTIDNLKVSLLPEAEEPPVEVPDFWFDNNFDDASLTGLENEELAKEIFGENNFIFGHGTQDPTMKIENGALRIVGDSGEDPKDSKPANNRTQFLLAKHEDITKDGVVVDLDYRLNSGSKNAFTFVSKGIVESNYIDSGNVWISGIWSNAGYRTSIRATANNNGWENPGIVNQSDGSYSKADTDYSLRIVATPTDGIRMYAKRTTSENYTLLTELTVEAMEKVKGITFADHLNKYVRLVVQSQNDVTIDNLKVYSAKLLDEKEEPSTEVGFFNNDFNDPSLKGLTNEELAIALFGEGNFMLGQGQKDAQIRIEKGALRLIGDNNTEPADGRKKDNRSQFLLASNEQVKNGVVIECDYTFHENSQGAFVFTSKPIARKGSVEADDVWISGLYSKAGYRTSLRCKATKNSWTDPGLVEQRDASYSTIGVSYKMKLVVSPTNGMLLYAKRSTSADYALIQHLTVEQMNKSGSTLFTDCRDGNVRLILHCLCDVTIDNLKVTPLTQTAEDSINSSKEVGFFNNNFNDAAIKNLKNADLAAVLFGEGNYLLGQGERDAQLRIENGALRIIGDNNVKPTDGRTQMNLSQFLLASNDEVKNGVVIECDYILNKGAENSFSFASKPITTGNDSYSGNIWISGVWANEKSRTALRCNGLIGKDWTPIVYGDNLENSGKIGVKYSLRLEVSPVSGLALYAKREENADYVRLGKWSKEQIATFQGVRVGCMDGNVRMFLQAKCDVTIDNLSVTPLAKAKPMPISKPQFYFNDNFNDPKYANLTNEKLAEAIFGKDNFLMANSAKRPSLTIENGALHLVGDNNEAPTDGSAKNNRSQFLIASHPNISKQGVTIECDYTFNAGAQNAFVFASRGLATTNDPKKAPNVEKDVWISGMWAGNKSRTAVRFPADWKPVAYGPSADASGKYNITYHMKLEVSPTTGLALYARSSAKGEYKRLGTWGPDDIALFTGEYSGCLDDNVRLLLQPDCDVTIDNLVAYPYGMEYEPYVEKVTFKLNGEETTLIAGDWDLRDLVEGNFLFAVVNGKVTTDSIVNISSDIRTIDVYTLSIDTLDGASASTTKNAALRWITTVNSKEYDALKEAVDAKIIKNFEVGTITMKERKLGGSGILDLDSEKNGAKVSVYDGKWMKNDAYEGSYVYAGSVKNISKSNYNTRYCGVGYATVTLKNNKKLTVYGGFDHYMHARSISQVASAARADKNNGLKSAQLRAIKPYAAAYQGEDSIKGMICELKLVEKGKANYRIVIPKNATTEESMAASQLKTALGSLTGVNFATGMDNKYREDAYEIVVGTTQFVQSQEAMNNLNRNQSCVRVVGNKIIINGFTGAMLEQAVTELTALLKEQVKKESNGKRTLVAKVKEEIRMTNDKWLLDIPEFRGGKYQSVYEVGNDNMQMHYTEADPDYIDSHVKKMENAGFTVKEDNTIGKNRYITFLSEEGAVYFNYYNYNDSVSVVTDAFSETVYKKEEPEYTKITETTLAAMTLDYAKRELTDGNGESFVITLEDGRYIIIDGGYNYDAVNMYKFLKDNNKRTDGKIHIAAWILSHAHGDHYGCFSQFTSDYGKEVKVDYLIATPGVSTMYKNGYDDFLEKNLARIAEETFGCEVIRPHTGNTLTFCNVEFQFLYTAEDYGIAQGFGTITSENNASLVFRMTVNGQTVLFTNDAEKRVSEMLCDTYGEALKSDVFQMNHHGAGGCIKQLCEYVNPDFSLWTTNQPTFEVRTAPNQTEPKGGKDQYESSLYLLEKLGREKCILADGPVGIIHFPLKNVSTDITYYNFQ